MVTGEVGGRSLCYGPVVKADICRGGISFLTATERELIGPGWVHVKVVGAGGHWLHCLQVAVV